jgi:hypothetical protein
VYSASAVSSVPYPYATTPRFPRLPVAKILRPHHRSPASAHRTALLRGRVRFLRGDAQQTEIPPPSWPRNPVAGTCSSPALCLFLYRVRTPSRPLSASSSHFERERANQLASASPAYEHKTLSPVQRACANAEKALCPHAKALCRVC